VTLSRVEKKSLDQFLGLLVERAEELAPKPLAVWIAELREYCLLPDQTTVQASLVRAMGSWRIWHEALARNAERVWPAAAHQALEDICEEALTTAVRAYGSAAQDSACNDRIRGLWGEVDRLTRRPA
jgi:hypothetical protein